MKEIIYPIPPKYFIAYTGGVITYGKVESDQCMATGLENIEVFIEEDLYTARLAELGIISQEEDMNQIDLNINERK